MMRETLGEAERALPLQFPVREQPPHFSNGQQAYLGQLFIHIREAWSVDPSPTRTAIE